MHDATKSFEIEGLFKVFPMPGWRKSLESRCIGRSVP